MLQSIKGKNKRSPHQTGVSRAAAARAGGGDAVDAAAAPTLEQVAEVEDPVGSYREGAQPVVLDAVLSVVVAAVATAVATSDAARTTRLRQHRLQASVYSGSKIIIGGWLCGKREMKFSEMKI